MKTIIFDIDDTLTSTNSWAMLNEAAGLTPQEDYQLYIDFMAGVCDYAEWSQKIAARYHTYNQLTPSIATKTLQSYILRADAKSTIEILQSRGYTCVLITGGFRETAADVAAAVGVSDYFYVTDLVFNNDVFVDFVSKGAEGEAKLRLLEQYCQKVSINLKDCLVVGDGANDVPMFNATGNGITFSWSKESVKTEARYVINELGDLPALLL
jgi:phosphoserine phosphatase